MSRQERIQLVGQLVVELEESVQNLKRAQQEGQDWLPHLISIADCFDKEKSTKIFDVVADGFTTTSGGKVIRIPSGDEISDVINNIKSERKNANDILEKLKTEHIDLCMICSIILNEHC